MENAMQILSWAESFGALLYFLVFFFASAESTLGLSMLVPGSVTVMLIGATASLGDLKIYYVIPLAILGAVVGDNISYFLGSYYGRTLVSKIKIIDKKALSAGEEFINKHGAKSIMLGRFVPFVKETIPFVAGTLKMDRRKFMLYNFLGAIGWSAMWPGMGYVFARALLSGDIWVGQIQLGVIVVIFIYLALLLLRELNIMKKFRIQILQKFKNKLFAKILLWLLLLYSALIYLTIMVIEQKRIVNDLDLIGFKYFFENFNEILFISMHIFTYSAKWFILLPIVLLLSLLFFRNNYIKVIIPIWTTLLFASVSVFVLKHVIGRPRPDYMRIVEDGAAFPSGHATISTAFAGIIIFFIFRLRKFNYNIRVKLIFALVLWAILIDLSRLYLGVHYMSDILGGILVGLISVILGVSVYLWLESKESTLRVVTNGEYDKDMIIHSELFENGENIPKKYTCDGENINPELVFENVPESAKSLVLIVDDPDVPKQIRQSRHFTHWLLYNLPTSLQKIEEGGAPGTQGRNDAGQNAYIGPCPPTDFEPTEHRYFFKLYALDAELDLPEGLTQKELEEAIKGHVLEQAEFYGVYDRAR